MKGLAPFTVFEVGYSANLKSSSHFVARQFIYFQYIKFFTYKFKKCILFSSTSIHVSIYRYTQPLGNENNAIVVLQQSTAILALGVGSHLIEGNSHNFIS